MDSYEPSYNTPRQERALERLAGISPSDAKAAVAARVPAFRDIRKTEYLVLRSVGFAHEEAMHVCGINEDTFFTHWIEKDPAFREWAMEKSFRELTSHVGEEVLRNRFLRNVFLQMHIDNGLLTKRAFTPSGMDDIERREALEASRRYSAPNISAMMRVLGHEEGEGDEGSQRHELVLRVIVDGKEVTGAEAKKAAARSLLDKFTVKGEVVEADYEVING